jgi:hypothetical protein
MSILKFLTDRFLRLFKYERATTQPHAPIQAPVPQVVAQPVSPALPIPLSSQQASALQAIWASAGSVQIPLATGTLLWHGGTIPNGAALLNTKALWCTRDPNKATRYDNWAVDDAQRKVMSAHRLELSLKRSLLMADFGSLSLQQFTMDHCKESHNAMKAALQAWCLQGGFDGVVNLNGGASEVVVCRPMTELTVVSSVKLWP